MNLLFSEEGLERLDAIVKPGLLCAFDFDGTLAPIVPQPEQAQLPADLTQRLIELSTYAPVAIITGRSVDDLRARLGVRADFIVGNHGLEGLPGWERRSDHYEALSQDWRDQLSAALHTQDDTGVWIENKRYSLSVHYRFTRDKLATEAMLRQIFTTLTPPPRVIDGKDVFNLLPEDAIHKGSALEQLLRATGASGAIYVGDDVTDEDVFRLRRSDVLSVRIEPSAASAATLYLERRMDISRLIDELIMRLRALDARNWTQVESVQTVQTV